MDLISRQAAIDAIEETDWYHQNQNGEMVHGANSAEHQPWYKADDVYNALGSVPSEDAIEVVRCKDCKHSTEWYRDKRRCFLWCEDGIDVFEDGYCSYWEKKNGRHDKQTDSD